MVERPVRLRGVLRSIPVSSNRALEFFYLSVFFFVVKTMIFLISHLLLKYCFSNFFFLFQLAFTVTLSNDLSMGIIAP